MKHALRIMLAFLLVLMFSAIAWADYTDTFALSSAEAEALNKLSSLQVVNGYPDGSFRPNATVTRAEFAKMICVFTGKTELKPAASTFSDVPSGVWYYGWVSRAAEQGWINGYPGGQFRPQYTITQQEIATVLVRLSGVNTAGFIWPDDYIDTAQKAGLLDGLFFVGVNNASRILTCQMLYNALPRGEESKPTANHVVRGIVMEIKAGSVSIKDGKNVSATYEAPGNLLPEKLIPGSYLEMEVSGNSVVKVLESVNAKKGTAYWDVSLDGTSAVINDEKYDLTDAEIFAVEYTLNKPYSADTFIKGGVMDRDILALGGRLAAEMAVVVDESGNKLKVAYLVNPVIIVSGGRLDVVDGNYNNSKGSGLYFLGRDAGLPVDSDSVYPLPVAGQFIHYTLKNGVINSYSVLFDINANGNQVLPTKDVLKSSNDHDPWAWVDTEGRASADFEGNILMPILPLVVNTGSGKSILQLGKDEHDSGNYWLAEGCLIYVVKNGNIERGGKSDIEKGHEVLALVNKNVEICYLFYFK
ncbi:MAG: S-layer homology domain-containing protein [Clostridiales bacterium]|nr:S-layer homology domain-containing protein [Clostridiales bacterium]